MAAYNDLAALRRDLTADNADRRVDAYMAVRDAGLEPDEVVTSTVPDNVVEALEAADVIGASGDGWPSAPEHREQMRELLEQIAANTDEIAANTGGS